ncbi:MAG: TetR family transcriptional regulator [Variovorax sp. 67-131]|nr:TetR/AcrR family transcriptional regulator [Variovorax sp.]ODU18204.1 MAG: TetR family transcriptional regulator [Variovorax sp. SCN 67-85]ODV26803.1 MAG: TetR family transcriptional regulator [Variovorax sp. SCN 67-20]OJZ08893.1 MAG: TetR family transcriptional regulator [Variovorax sp. 67-131]
MPGMNAKATTTQAPRRAPRADGAEARHRLLHTALRLFAQKGFAKTSTREIAKEADVNISAISYYFGDKEGLYAATFNEPMGGDSSDLVAACKVPGRPLEETLRICMVSMIDPLKQGEIVRQCIQLHMREMLEPTSRWAKELEHDIKGPHRAIADLLCRHLGVARADDDIHRLTFAITGLSMQLYVSQDFIEAIRPSLLRTARGIDTWADRLTGYAMALVAAEAARRRDERKPMK